MSQERLTRMWLAVETSGSQVEGISPTVEVEGLFVNTLYRSPVLQTMLVSDLSPADRFTGHDVLATYVRKRDGAEMEWEQWRHVEAMVTV